MTVRKGVRKEEERPQEVKRREQSNWRCPHTRQNGRGHEVKTKGRETDKTKSLNDNSFCSSTLVYYIKHGFLKGVQEHKIVPKRESDPVG